MSEATRPLLSRAAVVAAALGVSSLFLSLVTALPAMYVGLGAVRAINGSDGQLRGRRLAIAGLALGMTVTVITLLGCAALIFLYLHEQGQRAGCSNNLRQLGAAVLVYHDQHDRHFPSATIPNAALLPDERLSWQAATLVHLAAGTPAGAKWQTLSREIAFAEGWRAPANDVPRRTNVAPLRCPAFVRGFSTGQPGLTSYVGVAGVGADAASLPLDDPRAGCFGHDRSLTPADITAGISSTMMVVETTRENGPWLAGGPPTVRGLDPVCDRYIGLGRPFGGLHRQGLNVLWADGSVRFLGDQIEAETLRILARIHHAPGE